MSAPGVMIAAPASGCGTATLSLALLRALARTGLAVGSFKVGPDPIDPAVHACASGRAGVNLDAWAMRLETLAGLGDRMVDGVDLVLGQGVMGLFDGAGSSADLASLFDLPVVLVVDARGIGASAAALIEGFIRHRDDVEVAGVLFNRVRNERQAEVLRRACDDHFSQPVLGCLAEDERLRLPERRPGLPPAGGMAGLEPSLERAADAVCEAVDLDRLIRLARPFGLGLYGPQPLPLKPLGQKIAIAQDPAFAFAYPATVDGWRAAGADILPFSPLADQRPDPSADAIFLPGGWPELHAGRLAGNRTLLRGLRANAEAGCFVYGEGGGFMLLGETLLDRDGGAHAMAGLLPVVSSFEQPRLQQGYWRLRLLERSPLGRAGATFRGHECHQASLCAAGKPLFEVADARGRPQGAKGLRAGTVCGSPVHLIDRSTEPEGLFDPTRLRSGG